MVDIDFTVIGVNEITTDPSIRFRCVTSDGKKLYIGSDTSLDESAHVWEYEGGSFSRITDNLESESFKSINSILVDNGALYAGVGDGYVSGNNYKGQVWSNNSLKWVDTGLGDPNINLNCNYIRKIIKHAGKIYAAGSRYELFELDKRGWKAVITPRDGGTYPGRSDISDSYQRTAHWTDLTTDGSAIYASVIEAELYQGFTLAGLFNPSGIIRFDGDNMTQFSPPISYGAGGNRFINKLHVHDDYLYAATHNSISGTEVWRSPVSGSSWEQINENGFGDLENYVVNDIKTVDGHVLFSVMNSMGCQVWAYDTSENEFTKQNINSETSYNAFYFQEVGDINYLVGEAVQYLTQQSREELLVSAPQTYASGVAHLMDNGTYSMPLSDGTYRFITNNGPYPLVTQGSLDDPFSSIISPFVDRQADLDRGARGWCSPFDIYDTGASATLVSSFRYSDVLGKKPSYFSGELGDDLNGSAFTVSVEDNAGNFLSSLVWSAVANYGGPSGYENSGIRLAHPQTVHYDSDEDLLLIGLYVEEGNWGRAGPASANSVPSECNGPRNFVRDQRHKRASRLLVSDDQGLSFSDCGYLVTLPFNNIPNDNYTASGAIMGPANTAIIKRADPDTGEDYLYVYFDRFKNNIDAVANSLSVARAPYSAVIESAKNLEVADFKVYYNGSFSQSFSAAASATDVYPPNFRGYGSNYLNQPQVLKCTNSNVYAAIAGAAGITYDPYIVGVDAATHNLSIYTEDGINFSYPQRVLNRTPQFGDNGTQPVNPKYWSHYSVSSHVGETGDSFKSIDSRYTNTSAYGPISQGDSFWQTLEIKMTSMSSTVLPSLSRSFDVSRYVQDFSSKYAVDRGQLPGIYAAMHRIKEREKYLNAELRTSGVIVSYVNSATNGEVEFVSDPGDKLKNLFAFPKNTGDYYDFEFGRYLHRLYHTYHENFQWHRLSPDVQKQDGANIFSHTFGPLLYNHNFEKLDDVSLVASSFANPTKITVSSSAFTGAGSFVASSDDSMYLDTFERVSSGVLDGVELVLTSGTESDSSFSVIRVPSSQRASYEDPFLFDKTLMLMRSGVGAATRLRFDISKYEADSTHPVTKNFLSPDHEFKLDFDSLISRDSGTLLGGRSVGVWIHTKPEDGNMWSFTPEGKWVQHDQLVSRLDMLTKYAHKKTFESKQNDPQSTTSTTNYNCLDQVSTNRNSPVIGLGAEDFENFNIYFNTNNRHIRLSRKYQREYNKLHRLDQEYVIEIFIYPGTSPDQFMLLNSVQIQDITMHKLSKIFAAGTLSNPLCILRDLKKGCTELRVDLTKQDLFDIFKYFNDIAGKNAATAYASRDESKTETIMESRGGSRVEYRFPNALVEITPGTSDLWYSEVTIPV